MAEKLKIVTPVGRFISGSLTDLRTTDYNGRPIEPEKQRREFGLAIPKNDPGLPALFGQIANYAKGSYAHAPTVQQRIDGWFQTMSGFSMKISDGDKPNAQGVVNENGKGCFIIWFSTSLPIKTCGPDNQQIDASFIKRGYKIDVSGTVDTNGLTDHNAGVYMNPEWVRLVAYDAEIVGGVDAATAFGGQTHAPLTGGAPAGNVAGMPGGGMPGAPAPAPQQQYAPQAPAPAPQQQYAPQAPAPAPQQQYAPQAPAGQMPGAPAPAHDFVQNATGQAPAGMPGAPAPAPQQQYAPQAPAAPAPGGMPGMMPPRV